MTLLTTLRLENDILLLGVFVFGAAHVLGSIRALYGVIGIDAVMVSKMSRARRDSKDVLFVVWRPLNQPRWVVLSSVTWAKINEGPEGNQFITSLPVGTIELSDDWSVLRFPEKQHQPDFWIIGAHFMSTFTNHAGDFVISGGLKLYWNSARRSCLEGNDAVTLSDKHRDLGHEVRFNHR